MKSSAFQNLNNKSTLIKRTLSFLRTNFKIQKKIHLLIFVSILHLNLSAQNQISLNRPTITPVSSGAASMQKYTDYPVDHSTGIAKINIPLYEIKVGDLILPISISYHSAGLKPKEESGRVGTGWTLNAEPSIMRNIKGTADDAITPWQHTGIMHSPYRSSLPGNSIEQSREKARRIIDKEWDGESDRYTYNLISGGGTCYSESPKPTPDVYMVSHPRNNDVIIANKSSKITDFLIKDPTGVNYNFGTGPNSEETCGNDVTRWMCDTISSSKTKAKITFNYSKQKQRNPASYYGMDNMVILEDSISGSGSQTILTLQTDGPSYNYRLISPTEVMPTTHTDVYVRESTFRGPSDLSVSILETIRFGNNEMNFFYNGNILSFINVKDANGSIVRSIEFFISKYNPGTDLTKLDSIKISAPQSESKKYSFRYNSEYSVPSSSTRAIDHWGFCNRSDYNAYFDGNVITVPTIKTKTYFSNSTHSTLMPHTINGINREPDSSWTMVGTLNQITDPEGIQTQFRYSGNKAAFFMYYRGVNEYYDKNKQYLYPVGGLKVDRITTINPKTNLHTYRDFKYGLKQSYDNFNLNDVMWGGGAIKHIVTDRDYCIQHTKVEGTSSGYPARTSRIRSWSSMPVSEITFNNGSPVLYNTVVESKGSLSDGYVFKTIYHYTVQYHHYNDVLLWDDYHSPNPNIQELDYNYHPQHMRAVRKNIIRPFDVTDTFHDSDHEFGHLNKMEHFRNDTLVSATNYQYDYRFNDVYDRRGITVYRPYRTEMFIPSIYDVYGETNKKNSDKYSEYKNGDDYWPTGTTKWKALTNESTTDYFYNNGSASQITSSKAYEYPEYSVTPNKMSKVNSDNTPITNTYEYLSGYPDVLSYHKQLINGSSIESKVEFITDAQPSKVRFKTNLSTNYEDEVIYNEYDSYGNIADITGKDGTHTCYIWGYDNQHLLAQIVNITYAELLAALEKDRTWIKDLGNLIEPTETQLTLLNGLRNKLNNSQVSTYTYKPLFGITSICDPSSKTTYFTHDSYGRLTERYRIEDGDKTILQHHVYNFSSKDANLNESETGGQFVGINFLNALNIDFLYLTGNNEHWAVSIEGGSGFYKAEWKIGTLMPNTGVFNVTQTREYTYSDSKVTRSGANMIVPVIPTGSLGRIYCKITDLVTGISKENYDIFYADPSGQPHPNI